MARKLDILALGTSLGIVTALGIFLIGLVAGIWGRGEALIPIISQYYIGYKATLAGSIIGALWGFVDGFIGGVLVAWIYNVFLK